MELDWPFMDLIDWRPVGNDSSVRIYVFHQHTVYNLEEGGSFAVFWLNHSLETRANTCVLLQQGLQIPPTPACGSMPQSYGICGMCLMVVRKAAGRGSF